MSNLSNLQPASFQISFDFWHIVRRSVPRWTMHATTQAKGFLACAALPAGSLCVIEIAQIN
jgi:hypothetical protein